MDNTMRGDLDAALEGLDTSFEDDDPQPTEPSTEPSPQNDDEPEELPLAAEDTTPPTTDEPATEPKVKAPAGWTPAQREQWSKIPSELQQQITAREAEIAKTMANSSDSRNVHDRMAKLGQSYAPIMAAEGVSDPVQAAEGLFQTVSQLRMGTPQQKAETIANLINHYGVDITTLDDALVGKPQQQSPQTEMERILEEKMAPFNQMMQLLEQAKGKSQTQVQESAQQSVQDFAKNAEFLGDVRNDMADMIDFAHSRGQEMSLQDAYNKAVAMNPEISKVLEQRKIMGGNKALQQKRAASSSLNGKRSGLTAPPSGGTSMRDDITLALEALQQG